MVEVINSLLGYEKIKIVQCPEAFNFSIDSMLLASFCTINKKTKRIIDLCTGNAPIPLYLTMRTKEQIKGIEIQKKIYELGLKSVRINNMETQIKLYNDDLIGINKKFAESFDLVTCNPPFFKWHGNTNTSKSEYKKIARHEFLVTLDDIVKEAFVLLDNGGYFSMVHRPDRLVEIIQTFLKYKIEPKRIQMVYPNSEKEANHILIEGIKNGSKGGLKLEKPLIVYDKKNQWTKDILDIYNIKEG